MRSVVHDRESPIGDQGLACDERSFIARQDRHSRSDFGRRAHPAEYAWRHRPIAGATRSWRLYVGCGGNPTRADAVRPDPEGSAFNCQRARKRFDGRFGDAVQSPIAVQCGRRRNVDNRASAGIPYQRHGVGRYKIGGVQVGAAHLVPSHSGSIAWLNAAAARTSACVVDDDPQSPPLADLADQVLYLTFLRQIAREKAGFAFDRLCFRFNGAALLFIAAGERNPGTLSQEILNDSASYPRISAGHENVFTFEPHGLTPAHNWDRRARTAASLVPFRRETVDETRVYLALQISVSATAGRGLAIDCWEQILQVAAMAGRAGSGPFFEVMVGIVNCCRIFLHPPRVPERPSGRDLAGNHSCRRRRHRLRRVPSRSPFALWGLC